jgi:hypothetical protein
MTLETATIWVQRRNLNHLTMSIKLLNPNPLTITLKVLFSRRFDNFQ